MTSSRTFGRGVRKVERERESKREPERQVFSHSASHPLAEDWEQCHGNHVGSRPSRGLCAKPIYLFCFCFYFIFFPHTKPLGPTGDPLTSPTWSGEAHRLQEYVRWSEAEAWCARDVGETQGLRFVRLFASLRAFLISESERAPRLGCVSEPESAQPPDLF